MSDTVNSAPLSPDERIERAIDGLMDELQEARFRVVEQRMRGDELERQLAECRASGGAWKMLAAWGWLSLAAVTIIVLAW